MEMVETVKQKREKLLEQFNSLQDKRVELEKQLSQRKEQVLRLEGAIEALNMSQKEEGEAKVGD